jgi:hypothetical protein
MLGRFRALNIALLASALISAPGAAEIRKRVDEHGQVHYEDAPEGSGVRQASPAGTDDKPSLTPDQERLERQRRVLEAMESERRNKQQQKDKAGKERGEAAARCEGARQELERRRNAGYLYRKGGDGEKQIFSDEEHVRAIADAEAAVKKWCK